MGKKIIEVKPGIRPRRGSKDLPRAFRDPSTGEMVSTVEPLGDSPLTQQDRLTMSISLHHERFKEQPFSIRVVTQEMLDKKLDDPYYSRRQTFTNDWQPVDLGWIGEDAGTVVLENLEGKSAVTFPTEEQKAATERNIVELSYSKNSNECDLLRPGRPEIKHPSEKSVLYGRCQSEKAVCRVTVFSR